MAKNSVAKNELFLLIFHSFALTLPSKMAKILRLGKKRNGFFVFALDFS